MDSRREEIGIKAYPVKIALISLISEIRIFN